MTNAIVVGAGLAGIAAAARLARAGFAVTVVEKQARPGGRAGILERGGFTFDTGPTLFLMPAVFAETYDALGQRMEDHLDLIRLDPTYRVHFHDGSKLDLTADLEMMRRQLDAMESGAFGRYLDFLSHGYRHYQLSLDRFVGRNFNSLSEYFSLRNLPLMMQLKALVKHYDHTSSFFRDPRLRAAFSFQNMYLGLSPFDAPATFTLLQYTELGDGVWFPRGGMYEVIRSMAGLAEGLGVRFRYNSPVRSIDVAGARAEGVTLESGERVRADVVVANADLPYVYNRLLPDDGTAARLARLKYTASALMFYWGVSGGQIPELLHHNVFLADHAYRESFASIFRDHSLPAQPSFYIAAPAHTDPSFAPEGSENLMALVPVGHLDDTVRQDWDALKGRARQAVLAGLERIGVHDLGRRIVTEDTYGPPDYERDLNLVKGSAFGLSHNFRQVGYLRPHNRHPRYRNLYFAGASTHPGTGLPIVLLSARLTVQRILQDAAEPSRRALAATRPAGAMR